MCLGFWNLGFNLKGEVMSKLAKQGLQGTWAPRQWRPSGCFWVVWLVVGINVIFRISGVLRTMFWSGNVLRFCGILLKSFLN